MLRTNDNKSITQYRAYLHGFSFRGVIVKTLGKMVAVGMNYFQMLFGDDFLTILRSIREGAVFPNRDHG